MFPIISRVRQALSRLILGDRKVEPTISKCGGLGWVMKGRESLVCF